MKKKALIVVTSTQRFPNKNKATGSQLMEITHFYDGLIKQGWNFQFISPRGGYTPLQPKGLIDRMNEIDWKYYSDCKFRHFLGNTKQPTEVNADDFSLIYFAGGHGTVWDLYENQHIHSLMRKIYEKGGIIAAVCHGPVALCNLKLSNNEYFVKDRKLTSFSNSEQKQVEADKLVPFMLETVLRERGGIYSQAQNWKQHVVVDGRLITGQNPASTQGIAKAVLAHKW